MKKSLVQPSLKLRSAGLLPLFLAGLLLVGCTSQSSDYALKESLHDNPLTAEVIADQMIEYVTRMQIVANESGEEITESHVLRAIDDALVEGRALQKIAHDRQDAGKIGGFFGVNGSFAVGEVLMEGGKQVNLYIGYGFEVSVAPDVHVYLSSHVTPNTTEELFSELNRDLGELQNFYGPQTIPVGELSDDEWNAFRTVVLYSESLKKVIARAQIRGEAR